MNVGGQEVQTGDPRGVVLLHCLSFSIISIIVAPPNRCMQQSITLILTTVCAVMFE